MPPNTHLLLVHGPLVGPSVWAPFAAAAERRGATVLLPNLTHAIESGPAHWERLVAAAVPAESEQAEPITVVGHSGAGVYLPSIAARLRGRLQSLVFLDAPLPPRSGSHRTPRSMEALLDANTSAGQLRRWWEWWPADRMERAVPDPATRDALLADMPCVPRKLYDEPVPVPPGWSEWACGYVRLSEAYVDAADEAKRRGWPVIELAGHHLGLVTEPVRTLEAVDSIVDALGP